MDIYQFLKDLLKMWLACGQYPDLVIEDVKDEIFDIVKPANPLHITAEELEVLTVLTKHPCFLYCKPFSR